MITTTIALWRMFSLIYIHTYIYIYICTYIHTYIHTYIPFLLLVRDSCRRKALQVAPRNLFFFVRVCSTDPCQKHGRQAIMTSAGPKPLNLWKRQRQQWTFKIIQVSTKGRHKDPK